MMTLALFFHVTPVISLRSPSLCIVMNYHYAGYKKSNPTGKTMKAAVARKPVIKIAVVESDPLRFVGFRALFDSEPEFELVSAALPEISTLQGIDLILLGNRSGQNRGTSPCPPRLPPRMRRTAPSKRRIRKARPTPAKSRATPNAAPP